MTAVRLTRPPGVPCLNADDYGGLVSLLADLPDDAHHPDADLLDTVMSQPWALATLDALVRTTTVRQAARELEVHHKTLQSRTELLCNVLGWDPLDGHGRIRLGIAHLTWRLHHSRVLDLPAPTP